MSVGTIFFQRGKPGIFQERHTLQWIERLLREQEDTGEFRMGGRSSAGPVPCRDSIAVFIVFDAFQIFQKDIGREEGRRLWGQGADHMKTPGGPVAPAVACDGEDDILARLYAELFHSGSGEDALAGLRDGSLIAHEQYVPFASGTGVQTTAVVFVGGLRLDLSGKLARMRDDEPHAVILAYFSKPVRFQGLLCTGQDFQIDGILKQAVLESLHGAVFQTEKQQQRRGDSGHGQ